MLNKSKSVFSTTETSPSFDIKKRIEPREAPCEASRG